MKYFHECIWNPEQSTISLRMIHNQDGKPLFERKKDVAESPSVVDSMKNLESHEEKERNERGAGIRAADSEEEPNAGVTEREAVQAEAEALEAKRAEYQAVIGKRPYWAWGIEELQERIDGQG
jgi:hypothetical protein